MSTRIDISIGPVQGFVSQSRRTRDLWGSSYLLAFLSAHAMRGAQDAGGEIVQPLIAGDPLYRWVGGDRSGEAPRIGTLPNHFVVEVDSDAEPVAEAAVESFRFAWNKVCAVVRDRYITHTGSAGNGTETIWKRQIGAFWEITWTAGPSGCGGGLLARRKRWRSHCPPDEPGDKCTVMHDRQELSGFVRAQNSDGQDAFWGLVRTRLGLLDLRDNERLCAVAFVKRLFPRVAGDALGWDVGASHWPSTVYVGAMPWMRRVERAIPRQAAAYAGAVEQHAKDEVFSMQRPSFGLGVQAAGGFSKLDANYLHREFVMSERRCPLVEGAGSETRRELIRLLKDIYESRDEEGRQLLPPPLFYALLLADGDRLGRLLGKLGSETVSKALATFTCSVPDIVEKYQGVTVYAGGDDVLAMLPVPDALVCAEALSDTYRRAFADAGAKDGATLSAAVVFAQVRLPLNHVLDEAHRLLDSVAKDGNGRDSLAAAVLKPGGLHCQWVTTWARHSPDGAAPRAVDLLYGLVRQLETNAAAPGLSGALIYRMRDTLTRLCGWEQWRPGSWGNLPEDFDTRAILCSEIHHSLSVRMDDGAEACADELTASVWNLLGPARNMGDGGAGAAPKDNGAGAITHAGVDALLLARFLADPEQRVSDR